MKNKTRAWLTLGFSGALGLASSHANAGSTPTVYENAQSFLVGMILDAGLFTDRSAVTEKDRKAFADRIDMVGASLGLGVLGKRSRSFVGTTFSYGKNQATVLGGDFSFESSVGDAENVNVDLTGHETLQRWTFALFMGSNYSFSGDD